MGGCLSPDLRRRVVAFVEAGHSRRAAARHFRVADSAAIKLMRRVAAMGSCAPGRQGRPHGSGKLASCTPFLLGVVESEPDITMPALCARLHQAHEVVAAPASLSRLLRRHGLTYEKSADRGGARTRRRGRGAPMLDQAASAADA